VEPAESTQYLLAPPAIQTCNDAVASRFAGGDLHSGWAGCAITSYADARDVRRVYEMSFDGGVWRFWGQPGPEFFQRFKGRFSSDGRTIAARIEKSADGNAWDIDFDTRYTKVN
jgi:hypothetical protein